MKLVERHELGVGVGDENRTRAEQERRAPAVEKRHVGRKREHTGLEAGDGVHADGRHPEDLRDRHASLEALQYRKNVVGRTNRPEHDLGRRAGGDDVRRHPAIDQADGVKGRAEIGIDRKRQPTQFDEGVDELFDRRLALLRNRGVRRPASGGQPHAEDATRSRREPTVGRLAVDQEPATVGNRIRRRRTVAASLLADDKQQPDTSLPRPSQPLSRRDLRRQDPFGVARAAANQPASLDTAREERGHAVEVRGEHHDRVIDGREDVGAAALDLLFEHVVAERA